MGAKASQITSLAIVFSTVYLDRDQGKHQSSASLAFVWGIHRRPVNSPHKWPVTWKMFPFDDVIMLWNFISRDPAKDVAWGTCCLSSPVINLVVSTRNTSVHKVFAIVSTEYHILPSNSLQCIFLRCLSILSWLCTLVLFYLTDVDTCVEWSGEMKCPGASGTPVGAASTESGTIR